MVVEGGRLATCCGLCSHSAVGVGIGTPPTPSESPPQFPPSHQSSVRRICRQFDVTDSFEFCRLFPPPKGGWHICERTPSLDAEPCSVLHTSRWWCSAQKAQATQDPGCRRAESEEPAYESQFI